MSVAIIDYGSGNLHSALKAFERAAGEMTCAPAIALTSDPEHVAAADRVVLPGVGAFADCRQGLSDIDGMLDALEEAVRVKRRPFLGICVGMQLMATRGLEHGLTPGFDWIAGEVQPIAPADASLKIPHMGWNTIDVVTPHPLLDGVPTGDQGLHAYFVHSYQLIPDNESDLVARADYGGPVTAMVARETFAGTQFHPEKSQSLGLRLISNFLTWAP